MMYLLLAGQQNSGKTTLVGRIALELNRQGFEIMDDFRDTTDNDFYGLPIDVHDFYVVLKNGEKYILCYSWADYETSIDWLKNYLKSIKQKNIHLNLVVMASRIPPDSLYTKTIEKIGLTDQNTTVVPLAKITAKTDRQTSLNFYLQAIFNLVRNNILPQLI
ncbi:MAG: hypothetical protein HYU67_06595 [Flavobacteriia bacterium]|nr:hypothetical protein [Flavobacteriia bacterium]